MFCFRSGSATSQPCSNTRRAAPAKPSSPFPRIIHPRSVPNAPTPARTIVRRKPSFTVRLADTRLTPTTTPPWCFANERTPQFNNIVPREPWDVKRLPACAQPRPQTGSRHLSAHAPVVGSSQVQPSRGAVESDEHPLHGSGQEIPDHLLVVVPSVDRRSKEAPQVSEQIRGCLGRERRIRATPCESWPPRRGRWPRPSRRHFPDRQP